MRRDVVCSCCGRTLVIGATRCGRCGHRALELQEAMRALARFLVWVELEARASEDIAETCARGQLHWWTEDDARTWPLVEALRAGRLQLEWP